jgi:hypothetical protein
MTAAWLLIVVGLAAAGPPEAPKPFAPSPNECRESISVTAGEQFPALDANSLTATCSGVLVPSSQIAHLLALETWAWEMRAYSDASIAAAVVDVVVAQNQAERARRGRRVMVTIAVVATVSAGTMATIAF